MGNASYRTRLVVGRWSDIMMVCIESIHVVLTNRWPCARCVYVRVFVCACACVCVRVCVCVCECCLRFCRRRICAPRARYHDPFSHSAHRMAGRSVRQEGSLLARLVHGVFGDALQVWLMLCVWAMLCVGWMLRVWAGGGWSRWWWGLRRWQLLWWQLLGGGWEGGLVVVAGEGTCFCYMHACMCPVVVCLRVIHMMHRSIGLC